MRIPVRFSLLTAVAARLCVGIGIPATTFAGGGPAKPAATPKPDTQKKVWTNDDVERLNPEFVVKSGAKTGKKSPAALVSWSSSIRIMLQSPRMARS